MTATQTEPGSGPGGGSGFDDDGPTVTVTVVVDHMPVNDTPIALSSSDPDSVNLPATVIVHGGHLLTSTWTKAHRHHHHHFRKDDQITLTASSNGHTISTTIVLK